MHFLLTNSRCFSWSAVFSWLNWEQYMFELIVQFCRRSYSKQRIPFQSHHIHNFIFFELKPWPLVWLVVGSFCLPHGLFCSILLYSIHFSSPVTICFKNGMFSLCLMKHFIMHVEIWSKKVFYHLTYVESKHQSDQCSQTSANGFLCLIWKF